MNRPPLPLRVVKEHWASPVVTFYKPGAVPIFSAYQLQAVKQSINNNNGTASSSPAGRGAALTPSALEAVLGPEGYNEGMKDVEDSVQHRLADSMPETAPMPFVAFPITVQPTMPLPTIRVGGLSSNHNSAAAVGAPHGLAGEDPTRESSSSVSTAVSSYANPTSPLETGGVYRFLSSSPASGGVAGGDGASSPLPPPTVQIEHTVPKIPTWFQQGNGYFQKGVSVGVSSPALRGYYSTAARHQGIVSTYHGLCQVVLKKRNTSRGGGGGGKEKGHDDVFKVLPPDPKASNGSSNAGNANASAANTPLLKRTAPTASLPSSSNNSSSKIRSRTPPSSMLPWSPLIEGDLFFEGNRMVPSGEVHMATLPLSLVVGDHAVGSSMREVCAKEMRMSSLFVKREEEGGEVLKRVALVSLEGIQGVSGLTATSPKTSHGSSGASSAAVSKSTLDSPYHAAHWTLRQPHPFLLPEQMLALQPLDNPLLSGAASAAASNVRLIARTRMAVARRLREYSRKGSFSFKLLHFNPQTALVLLQITTSSLDEHQIRLALASNGLPMVGDFVYRSDLAHSISTVHRELGKKDAAEINSSNNRPSPLANGEEGAAASGQGVAPSAETNTGTANPTAPVDHSKLSFAAVAALNSRTATKASSNASAIAPTASSPASNPFDQSPLVSVIRPIAQLPLLWQRFLQCVHIESQRYYAEKVIGSSSSASRHHSDASRGFSPPDTFLVVEAVVSSLLPMPGQKGGGAANSGKHATSAVNAGAQKQVGGRSSGVEEAKGRSSAALTLTSAGGKGSSLSAPTAPYVFGPEEVAAIVQIVLAKGLKHMSNAAAAAGRNGGGGGPLPLPSALTWSSAADTSKLRHCLKILKTAARCDVTNAMSRGGSSSSIAHTDADACSTSSTTTSPLLPLIASLALGPCIALTQLLYPSFSEARNAIVIEDIDMGEQLMLLSRGTTAGSVGASASPADTISPSSSSSSIANAKAPILQRLSLTEAKTDVPMTFQLALKQKAVSLVARHSSSVAPPPPSALFSEKDGLSPMLTSSSSSSPSPSPSLLSIADLVKGALYTIASLVEGGLLAEEVGDLMCPLCSSMGHTIRSCPRRHSVEDLVQLPSTSSSAPIARSETQVLLEDGAPVETSYFAEKNLAVRQSVLGAVVEETRMENKIKRGLSAAAGDDSLLASHDFGQSRTHQGLSALMMGSNGGSLNDALAASGGNSGGGSLLKFVSNKTPSQLARRESYDASVPSFHRDGSRRMTASGKTVCQYCNGLHSVTECPKLGLQARDGDNNGNPSLMGKNGQPKQKVCPTSHKERFDTSVFTDVADGTADLTALFCIRCGKYGHYVSQCPTLPRFYDESAHCAVCLQRTSVVAHYSHQCPRRVKPPQEGSYETYHSCGVAMRYFKDESAAEKDDYHHRQHPSSGRRRSGGDDDDDNGDGKSYRGKQTGWRSSSTSTREEQGGAGRGASNSFHQRGRGGGGRGRGVRSPKKTGTSTLFTEI